MRTETQPSKTVDRKERPKNLLPRPVGRPRKFTTPEQLYEECCAYFDHTWNSYWPKNKVVRGSNGKPTVVTIKYPVPFTIQGLCLWLGVGRQTFKDYGKRAEFSGVIGWVETAIYAQQIEGAMLGFFSTRIVARRLGIGSRHKVF